MATARSTTGMPSIGDKFKIFRICRIGKTPAPKSWFNSVNRIFKRFQKPIINRLFKPLISFMRIMRPSVFSRKRIIFLPNPAPCRRPTTNFRAARFSSCLTNTTPKLAYRPLNGATRCSSLKVNQPKAPRDGPN